jgi:hypothetical protein
MAGEGRPQLKQLLPLALSANTIALMWLVGNRRVLGWWLAVGGQVGWFAFIVIFQVWGLIPMAVALTITYVRNLVKWRREQRQPCTGVAAMWCPNHGDCLCREPEFERSDPECPLHSVWSTHAEEAGR